MSRYLYISAAVLLVLALVAFGLTFTTSHYQPGLPASGSLWKTSGLFLIAGSLIVTLLGVMTAMFEQVGRRNRQRRRDAGSIIEFPGKGGRTGQEKYSPRDRSGNH